jgi:PmbA protein
MGNCCELVSLYLYAFQPDAAISMSDQDFSYPQDTLRRMAQDILDYAGSRGASACETDVSEGFGQSVTVRLGSVETIEYNRDKGVGVTVYLGQQRGYASTSDFSRQALRTTVDAALSIARFTAPDEAAGLPEPELLARKPMELDLYHPWRLPVEEAIDIARRCEAAAFAVSPLVKNSEGASISTHQSHFVSANSLGFMGGYASSRHYISCSVIAGEGDAMQRDDWYTTKRGAAELASPEAVGDYVARRALSRLSARQVPTCEVPVLFEAPLASTLIGNFVYAASGGSLYRKSSFLQDSLGTQVFAPHIHISERPHLPRGLASSPFDDDGVATRDREVVEAGVLKGYFLSTYTARKLGMQTTGNAGGSHNLIVRPGRHDLRGLIKLMGRGLLVTELLGQGVNYLTGDYSRGASGYWVENGEIRYPVQEITIAGNLKDMLRGIVAVGNDALVRGSKQVGSILVDRMTVAGA